jgi:cell division initiation protein
LFGYRRRTVDELVEEVTQSFEDVWRARADLADEVERLENDLVRYRELETLLRSTLVSAERASQELLEQARREAELVLTEAHAEARTITREALSERERLHNEARRIRTQLTHALETVEPGEERDPAGDDVEAEAA